MPRHTTELSDKRRQLPPSAVNRCARMHSLIFIEHTVSVSLLNSLVLCFSSVRLRICPQVDQMVPRKSVCRTHTWCFWSAMNCHNNCLHTILASPDEMAWSHDDGDMSCDTAVSWMPAPYTYTRIPKSLNLCRQIQLHCSLLQFAKCFIEDCNNKLLRNHRSLQFIGYSFPKVFTAKPQWVISTAHIFSSKVNGLSITAVNAFRWHCWYIFSCSRTFNTLITFKFFLILSFIQLHGIFYHVNYLYSDFFYNSLLCRSLLHHRSSQLALSKPFADVSRCFPILPRIPDLGKCSTFLEKSLDQRSRPFSPVLAIYDVERP